MFFKRHVEQALIAWKNAPKRKPLVLQGARQTGKTSLLKQFGKSAFQDNAYFNFEAQPDLRQFFEGTREVTRILENLSLVHGKAILPESTLIIFDEVQECYPALNALKYFTENAREYAIASAGSLLGVALGKEASFPVGKVDFIEIYPLTFSEFLSGADPTLSDYLDSIDTIKPIPDIFFNRLVEISKRYFISGGMPEAATSLVADNDIAETQKILRAILNAYALDFSKHSAPKDIAKISYVWNSVPGQLARENKKFLYQAIRTGARAREYEDALTWLAKAGLVHRIYQNNKPNLPLSAYDNLSAFKLYLLDVGLLRNMAHLDPAVVIEGNRLFTEFKGALAENFVLQSLVSQFEATPRYWTSSGVAEVDFIVQHRNRIIPIEVKSDENIRSRSLAVYHEKYKPEIRIRFSLKNLSFYDGLLNIPLFLADHTAKLIDLALGQKQ